MKFRYSSENHTVEDTFQMAAMVDIVFILLAFFVMATRFHQPEHDLEMGYRKAALLVRLGLRTYPRLFPFNSGESQVGSQSGSVRGIYQTTDLMN